MEYQERKRRERWMSMAIAAAAMLAATVCGGCLYTVIPAMAGPSTTYPQPADSQPAQASQQSQQSPPTNGQTNQNKQQNGVQPAGQGATP
ncbi:MAG TPA: hypothetical protein VNE82_01200 [Candidatus Binataceae bacterium]|nr:hypothetical protein [Candidatus Binataceae bacterium]